MATLQLPSVPKTVIGFDPSDSDDDDNSPPNNPNFTSSFDQEMFNFYQGVASQSQNHFKKNKKKKY